MREKVCVCVCVCGVNIYESIANTYACIVNIYACIRCTYMANRSTIQGYRETSCPLPLTPRVECVCASMYGVCVCMCVCVCVCVFVCVCALHLKPRAIPDIKKGLMGKRPHHAVSGGSRNFQAHLRP